MIGEAVSSNARRKPCQQAHALGVARRDPLSAPSGSGRCCVASPTAAHQGLCPRRWLAGLDRTDPRELKHRQLLYSSFRDLDEE
jgi:hypothetical protein